MKRTIYFYSKEDFKLWNGYGGPIGTYASFFMDLDDDRLMPVFYVPYTLQPIGYVGDIFLSNEERIEKNISFFRRKKYKLVYSQFANILFYLEVE